MHSKGFILIYCTKVNIIDYNGHIGKYNGSHHATLLFIAVHVSVRIHALRKVLASQQPIIMPPTNPICMYLRSNTGLMQ